MTSWTGPTPSLCSATRPNLHTCRRTSCSSTRDPAEVAGSSSVRPRRRPTRNLATPTPRTAARAAWGSGSPPDRRHDRSCGSRRIHAWTRPGRRRRPETNSPRGRSRPGIRARAADPNHDSTSTGTPPRVTCADWTHPKPRRCARAAGHLRAPSVPCAPASWGSRRTSPTEETHPAIAAQDSSGSPRGPPTPPCRRPSQPATRPTGHPARDSRTRAAAWASRPRTAVHHPSRQPRPTLSPCPSSFACSVCR